MGLIEAVKLKVLLLLYISQNSFYKMGRQIGHIHRDALGPSCGTHYRVLLDACLIPLHHFFFFFAEGIKDKGLLAQCGVRRMGGLQEEKGIAAFLSRAVTVRRFEDEINARVLAKERARTLALAVGWGGGLHSTNQSGLRRVKIGFLFRRSDRASPRSPRVLASDFPPGLPRRVFPASFGRASCSL